MSYSLDDYRAAAVMLWGDAGAFVVDAFGRFNHTHFRNALPALPIVVGLTAYGHCLGLTRHRPGLLPRISLASWWFPRGARSVQDVLLHEMLHAELMLTGRDHKHNTEPWCDRIRELSPLVLGHPITVAPVKLRRVDGKPTRRERDGYLSRQVLARWPYSLRPSGYYAGDQPISVDSY